MQSASSQPRVIPVDQVLDDAWRRLDRAADDPSSPMRICTLSTVTPEGRPAGRLMLLRGADRDTARIWSHTRRESAKVADLRAKPLFSLVAYDAADHIQLRISGSAKVHELDESSHRHFEQSVFARLSGQLPATAVPDPVWPNSAELLVTGSKRDAWKHFAVVEMLVESIDWTQVVGEKITHVLAEATANWRAKELG